MNPTQLLTLLQQAHTLHAVTKDPMIPSAIRLLSDAYANALAHDDPVVLLSEQQTNALLFLDAMSDAYLTLFGVRAKPPPHEYPNDS